MSVRAHWSRGSIWAQTIPILTGACPCAIAAQIASFGAVVASEAAFINVNTRGVRVCALMLTCLAVVCPRVVVC